MDEGRNRFLVDDGTGSAQVELHEDFEMFDPTAKIRINPGDRVRVSGLIGWGYRMMESSPKRERQLKALQLKKLPKIGGALEMARTWSRTTELHREVYSRSLIDVMPYFTPLPRKLVVDMGDKNGEGPKKSLFEKLLECEKQRKLAPTQSSSSSSKHGPTGLINKPELIIDATESNNAGITSSQESILFIQLVLHVKGIIETYHSDAQESKATKDFTFSKALLNATSTAITPSTFHIQKTLAEKDANLLCNKLNMGSWIIGDTLVDDSILEENVDGDTFIEDTSNIDMNPTPPLAIGAKQVLLPRNFTSYDIAAILQVDRADFVRSLVDAQNPPSNSLNGTQFLEKISQAGLVSLANDGFITSNDGNKTFMYLSIEKVIAPAMIKALRHLFEQWRLDKEAEDSLKSDELAGQNSESTLVDEIIDVESILHGLRPHRKIRHETSDLPVFSHSLVVETAIALGFLSQTVTAAACKKAATFLESTHLLLVVDDFEYRLMTDEDMQEEKEMETVEMDDDDDDDESLEETLEEY